MILHQASLDGRTILLTGAAGFFGRHFARAIVGAGAIVILVDQKKEPLESLHKELVAAYGAGRAHALLIDLYDEQAARIALQELLHVHSITAIINNAFDFSPKTGFNVPEGRLPRATRAQFEACFTAGVYWAFLTTQILGSAMAERDGGVIVNIGTMYADAVPNPALYEGTDQFNPWGYSASKGALLQFTKYSAAWLAPKVRVNMLSPGAIPNTENPTNNKPDSRVSDRLIKKILLGRMGTPDDLIPPLLFLLSDASRYMTGQNIHVDGGIGVTVT
ncbi:MAG: SDR family oxidoreductase [bacterium]|nr:SDR family oxidoreductase [bacterium]